TQWRRHVCSHQFSALIREARAALVRSRPAARSRDAWKDSRHCVTRVATRKSRGPHWLFAPQAYATKRALNGWGAMRNRRGHTAGKRKIGRASCRERGESSGGAVGVRKEMGGKWRRQCE